MKKSLFSISLLIASSFLLPLTGCTHSSSGSYDLYTNTSDPIIYFTGTVAEASEYIKTLTGNKTYGIIVKDDTETSCSSLFEALCSFQGATRTGNYDESYVYEGPKIILDIEETILDIGGYTFYGRNDLWCYSLKEIVLPKNCTEIGEKAFRQQANLEKVTFPNTLTKIEYAAFHACYSLKKVDLSNTQVKEIGEAAFEIAFDGVVLESPLTSIKFPNTLKTIGVLAFEGCAAVKSLEFPDSLETIERKAFQDCELLEIFNIPKSVTKIGYRAFYLCSSIKNITCEKDDEKVWAHNPEYVNGDTDDEPIETPDKDNTTVVHCFDENPMYFLTSEVEEEVTLTCTDDCECEGSEEKECNCKGLSRDPAGPTKSGGHAADWGCNYWWYRVSS